MPIVELTTLIPQSKAILAEYGLHCFDCQFGAQETLAQGCRSHGMTDEDIDDLVTDLSDALREQPLRPATLTITPAAATALMQIARQEHRAHEGLSVSIDAHGGFCLEFRPEPLADEQTFGESSEPELRVFASALTLQRIGGATIDFRSGTFKLDLPEDAKRCCQGSDAGCACRA